MKRFNILLLIVIYFSSYDFVYANECKIHVDYVNNPIRFPWQPERLSSAFYKIEKDQSRNIDLKHMRSIENTSNYNIRIEYWNFFGDQTKYIDRNSTRSVSGDLKKVKCIDSPENDKPSPKLIFKGSEEHKVEIETEEDKKEEKIFIRYNLAIENYDSFPDEMFRSAPDLPPCGSNENSSRTWLEIFLSDNIQIYGYCNFDSSNLKKFSFSVEKSKAISKGVYIILNDREKNFRYKSNTVSVQ